MNTQDNELQELRRQLEDLSRRMQRMEAAMGLEVKPQIPQAPAQAPSSPPPKPSPGKPANAVPAPPPPPLLRPPEPFAAMPVAPNKRGSQKNTEGAGDLESMIGSHWLNRIGISAVLIGVSYFLKYAFENNWIGPSGRVAIGLLAGIAVVMWSERFRNRGYKVFSFSLKAVGIGVLYLSLWAAFQVYHLVPSSAAFVAMLAVTASTATLAINQDAEILGAFALIGGFSTPVLLSTGENREVALFSYVALLNMATLAMTILKPWHRLLALSFAGTVVLYLGWYGDFYNKSQIETTIVFASLFFAVFALAPLVGYRSKADSSPMEWIFLPLALLNAGCYFLAVYVMVSEISATDAAWFALALAAVYIGLSKVAPARHGNDPIAEKQRLLHLALAIGFITIAIPIRLDSHWITLGWFVESAVLLWVGDRTKSDVLDAFAIGALILGILRLLLIDNFYSTQLLLNARMATYTVAILVLGAVAWLGSKRQDDKAQAAATGAVIALNILALVALSHEISDYYSRQMGQLMSTTGRWTPVNGHDIRALEITRDFTYSALFMSYGALLMVIGFVRRSAFVRWQALILIAATTLKVFVYDTSELDRVYRILSFIALGVLLLAVSFAYQKDWLKLSERKSAEGQTHA